MSEEWGPWTDHDGRGCPCVGSWVKVETRDGRMIEGRAGSQCAAAGVDTTHERSMWMYFVVPRDGEIIRYRIRKPRGMTILENLIADLPAPSLEPSPINETAPREELPV